MSVSVTVVSPLENLLLNRDQDAVKQVLKCLPHRDLIYLLTVSSSMREVYQTVQTGKWRYIGGPWSQEAQFARRFWKWSRILVPTIFWFTVLSLIIFIIPNDLVHWFINRVINVTTMEDVQRFRRDLLYYYGIVTSLIGITYQYAMTSIREDEICATIRALQRFPNPDRRWVGNFWSDRDRKYSQERYRSYSSTILDSLWTQTKNKERTPRPLVMSLYAMSVPRITYIKKVPQNQVQIYHLLPKGGLVMFLDYDLFSAAKWTCLYSIFLYLFPYPGAYPILVSTLSLLSWCILAYYCVNDTCRLRHDPDQHCTISFMISQSWCVFIPLLIDRVLPVWLCLMDLFFIYIWGQDDDWFRRFKSCTRYLKGIEVFFGWSMISYSILCFLQLIWSLFFYS